MSAIFHIELLSEDGLTELVLAVSPDRDVRAGLALKRGSETRNFVFRPGQLALLGAFLELPIHDGAV